MKKKTDQFIEEISRIRDPEVFLGVARILRVPLVQKKADKEEYEARDFSDILGEVMTAYDAADRTRRRELLCILKKANKAPAATTQEESPNANRTENSEAIVPDQEVQ